MKLAFCLFKYFPYGGLQRDCARVMRACVARGYEVHLFTRSFVGDRIDGVQVHEIPVRAWTIAGKTKKFVKKVLPLLEGFDCVMGFNRMPGLDIYFMGDVCFRAEAAQRARWHRLTARYKLYSAYEKIVCDAESRTQILLLTEQQKLALQTTYQTPLDRMTVLPAGIEVGRITCDAAVRLRVRAHHHLTDEDRLIVMIGSDFYRKGVDRALSAFQQLPAALQARTHLYIIGKGRAHSAWYSHPHIHYLGARPDAPDFLCAADLFLHVPRTEAAGMVLIEALVAQTPILTVSEAGYASYVTQAKAGVVLSAPFSQADLNQALRVLLNSDLSLYRLAIKDYLAQHDMYRLTDLIVDAIEKRS